MDINNNIDSKEDNKVYKTKAELTKKIDSFEKRVSFKDRLSVYLTSFKIQLKVFSFIFYIIPFLLTLVYFFINLIEEDTLYGIFEFFGGAKIADNISAIYGSFYNFYLTYVNFGWLLSPIFSVQDTVLFFVKIIGIESTEDLPLAIVPTSISYMLLTASLFALFTFLFKNKEFMKVKTKMSKLNKELQKEYIKSASLNSRDFNPSEQDYNSEKSLMKEGFKNDSNSLKKVKQDILAEIKAGRASRYEMKATFGLAMDNVDSPFGNQVATLANKNILKEIEELEKVTNREELYALLFNGFSKFQKDIIFSYNFNLFNDTSKRKIKEHNGGFSSSWDKLLTSDLNKEQYVKVLFIIYFFKNYPLSLVVKYLKSKDIVLSREEKILIENSRWIINYFIEKEKVASLPILDLPLRISFPDLNNSENKNKLISIYQMFLKKNFDLTLVLKKKELPAPAKGEEPEVVAAREAEENRKYTKEINIYKISLKGILKKMILIIFNDLGIEEKKNFDLALESSINEYFSIKSNFNFNENKKLMQSFSTFSLTEFYGIINLLRKKLGIYDKEIIPYYESRFNKLNVLKTFMFIEQDKKSIYK